MRIVVGLAGSIAAYKTPFIIRQLRQMGHEVRVIPTQSALQFIGRSALAAVSGHAIDTSVFDDPRGVDHVAIGEWAELVLIAPASADLIARLRIGRADDLLTATALVAQCPIAIAPAMHSQMWAHPATRDNIEVLRSYGVHIIEPAVGRLTGPDSGPGRLPDPEQIVDEALAFASSQIGTCLAGKKVVISAGGTREAIDPVRYIGNRSSGRQGVALANAAFRQSAQVTLIAGTTDEGVLERLDRRINVIRTISADEMYRAVRSSAADADVVIMAAAVADFKVADRCDHKMKKSDSSAQVTITLTPNVDILSSLTKDPLPNRHEQIVVGFAAETGDEHASVLDYGRIKARKKGADLLVVNEVGAERGFGDRPNEITILNSSAEVVATASGSKETVAYEIIATIGQMLNPNLR